MRAMILAAGLGTRLRPWTETKAKPAIEFLGKPLGLWVLEHLEKLGPEHLVVNVHHLPETVKETFDKACGERPFDVSYSDETKKILGSGGGVWKALPTLFADSNKQAIIANGDEVMFFSGSHSLKDLVKDHEDSGALATFLTTSHPELGKTFGGIWTMNNEVKGFGKSSPFEGSRPEHFTGFYMISKELMPYFPQGESHILYDVVQKAMNEGESTRTLYNESIHWFETGDIESFKAAELDCKSLIKK